MMHANEMRLFWAKEFPPTYTTNVDKAAIGTPFDLFSDDTIIENWTHHLPDNERMRYVLRYSCRF